MTDEKEYGFTTDKNECREYNLCNIEIYFKGQNSKLHLKLKGTTKYT